MRSGSCSVGRWPPTTTTPSPAPGGPHRTSQVTKARTSATFDWPGSAARPLRRPLRRGRLQQPHPPCGRRQRPLGRAEAELTDADDRHLRGRGHGYDAGDQCRPAGREPGDRDRGRHDVRLRRRRDEQRHSSDQHVDRPRTGRRRQLCLRPPGRGRAGDERRARRPRRRCSRQRGRPRDRRHERQSRRLRSRHLGHLLRSGDDGRGHLHRRRQRQRRLLGRRQPGDERRARWPLRCRHRGLGAIAIADTWTTSSASSPPPLPATSVAP